MPFGLVVEAQADDRTVGGRMGWHPAKLIVATGGNQFDNRAARCQDRSVSSYAQK